MNNKSKVIDHFAWYYKKGYITARDGNAAYRTAPGEQDYMITCSGTEKQNLKKSDFSLVDHKGKQCGGGKPSIETGAHVAALNMTGKNASVHVHSPNTVALAALFEKRREFKPDDRHLVSTLNSKWPELFRYTKVGNIVPFLEPGSDLLHQEIVLSLKKWLSGGNFDIVIMQRHGVLAVGNDLDECMEHIVRLEHVSGVLLKIITASGNLESIL